MNTTLSQATLDFLQQPLGSFINGEVITAKTQEPLEIFNPATGLAIATVPVCTNQDLEEAVQYAHESFADGRWANMRPAERERILYKLSELLIEHQEILAQLETLNQGKCIRMARVIEVGSTA